MKRARALEPVRVEDPLVVGQAASLERGMAAVGVEGRDVGKYLRDAAKGRSLKRAAILATSVAGYTVRESAAMLGMAEDAVTKARYRMRRAGMLKNGDDLVDNGIVPEAIEQLEVKVREGNLEAVLAVLRGRGMLKTHAAGPATGASQVVTNLVVKFDVPVGVERAALVGQVVGTPRGVE